MHQTTLLFLCTGNSCRSQMAEGYARTLLDKHVVVESAGIDPKGIHPRAITCMLEDRIDISQQKSTRLTNMLLERADIVITLCGDAQDRCPALPNHVLHEHWNHPDPAKALGNEAQITACFRQVRDEIKQRIIKLMARLDDKPL